MAEPTLSIFADPVIAATSEVPMLLEQIRERAFKLARIFGSPSLQSYPSDAAAGMADLAKVLASVAGQVPVPLAVQAMGVGAVTKLLDPWTEMRVTLDAARSRFWRVCDLFESGKAAEAQTEVQGILAMVDNLATPATPAAATDASATEKSTVTFENQDALISYAAKESALLAGTTLAPEELAKRAAHFQGVAAAVAKSLENTSEMPKNIPVVMSTVYAPDAGAGIKVTPGISTVPDQTRKELSVQELSNTFSKLGKSAEILAGKANGTPAPAAPAADVAKAAAATKPVWPAGSLTAKKSIYE